MPESLGQRDWLFDFLLDIRKWPDLNDHVFPLANSPFLLYDFSGGRLKIFNLAQGTSKVSGKMIDQFGRTVISALIVRVTAVSEQWLGLSTFSGGLYQVTAKAPSDAQDVKLAAVVLDSLSADSFEPTAVSQFFFRLPEKTLLTVNQLEANLVVDFHVAVPDTFISGKVVIQNGGEHPAAGVALYLNLDDTSLINTYDVYLAYNMRNSATGRVTIDTVLALPELKMNLNYRSDHSTTCILIQRWPFNSLAGACPKHSLSLPLAKPLCRGHNHLLYRGTNRR